VIFPGYLFSLSVTNAQPARKTRPKACPNAALPIDRKAWDVLLDEEPGHPQKCPFCINAIAHNRIRINRTKLLRTKQ